MTGIDSSYEVLVFATRSSHMDDVDWVQSVNELEIILKRFAGGVIIRDKLESTLARIPAVGFYIVMTSRYPEDEVKSALMRLGLIEGFGLVWHEIKDRDFLVA